jgi:isopenicillin N synthase-like dioxygenase
MSATNSIVPIIDVSALLNSDARPEDRQHVIEKIGNACKDIGFLIIVGHQIPNDMVNDIWKTTKEFFDLPVDEKLQYVKPQDVYPFGYNALGAEVLQAGKDVEKGGSSSSSSAVIPPDIKELFSLGPADPKTGFPSRIFPNPPADFEASWTTYYDRLANLAQTILKAFAISLNLETNFFDQFITHHASALRAINYPAIPKGQTVLPGQLRASAHTDYGTITILKTDGPGLQVSKDLDPPVWHDVQHVEGAFVINLGDLMRRWTNDKWLSTLHRVVITTDDLGFQNSEESQELQCRRRQSLAFFHNINRDAKVECLLSSSDEKPKHEPIIAGEFLLQKHLASIGMKK